MELKITEEQLHYLITIIEQNLERLHFEDENYMDMLHNLYSKLVILTSNEQL